MGLPALHHAWIDASALRDLLHSYGAAEEGEPCGVLLGRVQGDAVRIREAPPLPNVHPDPQRAFRIAPHDLLERVRAGREQGLSLVGFWHGHLVGPADPGEADLAGMEEVAKLGANARVLVIAGRGGGSAPVVRAWVRGERGQAREIPLGT